MKIIIQKIVRILQENLAIPVFDTGLPDKYTGPSIVLKKITYNRKSGYLEYELNICSPDVIRGEDKCILPDVEKIDALFLKVRILCDGFRYKRYVSWVRQRRWYSYGNLHYLSVCLTINLCKNDKRLKNRMIGFREENKLDEKI